MMARAQRNKLQGSLIRGTFRIAMPYVGMLDEHMHVSGMVVTSVHSATPITLPRFSKAHEIMPMSPILYSVGSVANGTVWALNPQLWCFMRILVRRDDPLLEKLGAIDGTLPALFREGDIEIVQSIR